MSKMSNIYKESMQQMKFSEGFDQATISKMIAAAKIKPSKTLLRALCGVAAAAAVTAAIIVGNRLVSDPRHSGISLGQQTEPLNVTAVLSVRETILERQEYGAVRLSTRSAGEIRELAASVGISECETVSCYEDEEYFYFFYPDGTVAGVMATYLRDNPDADIGQVCLSEDEAVALAEAALLKYCDSYTEETADRFLAEAWNAEADGVPHYPEWRITFTERTASGIVRNTVNVEIDTGGRVAAVFFGMHSGISDEELEDKQYISKEDAVLIALWQLQSEGREVDLARFSVTATLIEHEGKVVWTLHFEENEDADGGYAYAWRQHYWVILDAGTGEWIRTDVGR